MSEQESKQAEARERQTRLQLQRKLTIEGRAQEMYALLLRAHQQPASATFVEWQSDVAAIVREVESIR